MKLIAAFAIIAILSQQQPGLAQELGNSPILLAQHPTPASSPFVSRPTVRYAGSPRTSNATAPVAGYPSGGVVTYGPATPYSGRQTVYRPPALIVYPEGCCPDNSVNAQRPAYVPPYAAPPAAASPGIPAGYYAGRGIIGQHKLYATGQPIRNMLRFLTY